MKIAIGLISIILILAGLLCLVHALALAVGLLEAEEEDRR